MVAGREMGMRSDVNAHKKNLEDGMMRGANVNLGDNLQSELELLLRGQRNGHPIYEEEEEERDQNIYRSGSAPPTVEGSFIAVGSLFGNSSFELGDTSISSADALLSEEELRSHPAYLAYYYSNDNLNPRLPPPLLSREDWRVAQRFQAGGSSFCDIGEWKKINVVHVGGSSSLFSMQPSLSVQSAEEELMELRRATPRNLSRPPSTEWLDRGPDGLIGISGAGLGMRRKSFADILQEGLERPKSSRLSRPSSHNSFGDIVDSRSMSRRPSAEFLNRVESTGSLQSLTARRGIPRVRSIASGVCQSFASSAAANLSRSRTPEPLVIGRSPSSSLQHFGSGVRTVENKTIKGSNGIPRPSSMTQLAEFAASISKLSPSRNQLSREDSVVQSQIHIGLDKPGQLRDKSNGRKQHLHLPLVERSKVESLTSPTSYTGLPKKHGIAIDCNVPKSSNLQLKSPRTISSATLASKMDPPGFTSAEGSHVHRQTQNNTSGTEFPPCKPDGASSISKKANGVASNHLDAGSTRAGARGAQNIRSSQQAGPHHHLPCVDPQYIQYLQKMGNAVYDAASSANFPQENNLFCAAHAHAELLALQKAYLETLLAQQSCQYEAQLLHNSGALNLGYFVNPAFGICTPFQGNPMVKPVFLSGGSESPVLVDERTSRYNSMVRSSMGGSSGSRQSEVRTNKGVPSATSLLEELKNNKAKSFELSDIVGHVVEFSMDQYGSRFIQQKLETATVEQKKKIFPEVILNARALMTDVFGNYVIQKYFEHGTEGQRKELVSQLSGHVLPLSLQMYGCRVIQKALEVLDVEKQTQIVAELDGFVIKCVRDQNGNHVIQKCLECIPEDQIQFIFSAFCGQVVQLSSHPYGCRVIQRVLEHCDGPKTVKPIMDEIMKSVCTLAQDQYGNYVIQHVLQRGKPQERSTVIKKLAGQIVKMSQQKFASNVVEKCLTFGGPEERQLLVNEMLGSTDENEPLQAMMKDPYGNYVVQKVLETCTDQSRELILSRIKVHLTTLKRYTYGKHIVSRVEKLITAGERRRRLASS